MRMPGRGDLPPARLAGNKGLTEGAAVCLAAGKKGRRKDEGRWQSGHFTALSWKRIMPRKC